MIEVIFTRKTSLNYLFTMIKPIIHRKKFSLILILSIITCTKQNEIMINFYSAQPDQLLMYGLEKMIYLLVRVSF